MSDKVWPLVCQQCAQERTNWTERCPHAMEVWKDGYNHALEEYRRPRLTSEDVRLAGQAFELGSCSVSLS
jgi:hypothetical protein